MCWYSIAYISRVSVGSIFFPNSCHQHYSENIIWKTWYCSAIDYHLGLPYDKYRTSMLSSFGIFYTCLAYGSYCLYYTVVLFYFVFGRHFLSYMYWQVQKMKSSHFFLLLVWLDLNPYIYQSCIQKNNKRIHYNHLYMTDILLLRCDFWQKIHQI